MREMVTSDFFPLQGHKLVNAVYITSRYGAGQDLLNVSGVKPDPDGPGGWNYLMAYVGHHAEPGQPMTVLHRVCMDWGSFVRTSGWHGLDVATDAGTTYGIGKSMRSAEGKGDTGRRILFAWMTNGYWAGNGPNRKVPYGENMYAQGLPKDSLSLPRDMTFAADTGRLLQQFVPELQTLRIAETHEQLPLTVLSDDAPVWFKTSGRQLEISARFEVAGNCSFGLLVLASEHAPEFTKIGVDITDDLTFVDRSQSSGPKPLVPNRAILDVRAGLLPPDHSRAAGSPRTIGIHVIVDGPIVTFIVANETALSVYVYPQLQSSAGAALWASSTGAGAAVRASADVWQLRSVF
jgi:sucrose-6-phosphate hydrolase SacC (GH32 family)